MKAISYSLFGNSPTYSRGVLENCERAKRLYPGWTVYVWTDGSTDHRVLEECTQLGAVVRSPASNNPNPVFLRFRVAGEAEVFISRDADCRLSRREAEAVGDWLDSGRPFHMMHDHYWHTAPIMGGLWGARSAALPDGFLDAVDRPYPEGTDQHFLRRWLWRGLLEDAPELYINHHANGWRGDSPIPFPSPRSGRQFVGDTYFRENHLSTIDK